MAPIDAVKAILMVAVTLIHYSSAKHLWNLNNLSSNDIFLDNGVQAVRESPDGQVNGCKHKVDDSSEIVETMNAVARQKPLNYEQASNEQVPEDELYESLKCTGLNRNLEECREEYDSKTNEVSQKGNVEFGGQAALSVCTDESPRSFPDNKVYKSLNSMCKKLIQNGQCHLPHISFPLQEASPKDLQFNVILDRGFIYGMSNFKVTGSPSELLLKWKRLFVKYTLTTEEHGKESEKEIELQIPPFFMVVSTRDPESSPDGPTAQHPTQFRMTEVDELELMPTDLSQDVTERVVNQCLKRRIREILNDDLRKFLFTCLKEAFDHAREEKCGCLNSFPLGKIYCRE